MANPINNANTPNIETRGGLYPDVIDPPHS